MEKDLHFRLLRRGREKNDTRLLKDVLGTMLCPLEIHKTFSSVAKEEIRRSINHNRKYYDFLSIAVNYAQNGLYQQSDIPIAENLAKLYLANTEI